MSPTDTKNPEYLLTLVKKDELKANQGKLKVFLGMVAGVGKTFAMLQAAKQRMAQGEDIIVGWVETHGRKDTESLLPGLDIFPRKKISYRNVELEEFDLDGIIKRKPKIVLIDELAHTNVIGSRHKKRYLDVLEILDAGIDVYTTVNVQHLESRVDTVRDITSVDVQETVPDSILDRADEVVLIDLAPEELLKRLREGKVYAPESAEQAANNFFQKGNLTALREMALRVATERVDRELREFKTLHGIEGVWKTSGRLMVAVFASPYSEILIRWTRRVADLLGMTWIGAYVGDESILSESEKKLLTKNISLVQQLGGEVVSTRDDDAVTGLLRIAQQNNVTQIIVGKSLTSRLGDFLRGGSIVDRLLKQSGSIDIYVVAGGRHGRKQEHKKLKRSLRKTLVPWDEMGWVLSVIFGVWVLASFLSPMIGYLAVGVLFLLAVSLAGLVFSRFSVFTLALVFSVIHNFFFIPPLHTFTVSKPEDFMMLAMFFVAAAVIGHLTTRLMMKERTLKSREKRAMTLYGLTKEIASAQSIVKIIEKGIDHLSRIVSGEFAVFLKTDGEFKPLAPNWEDGFFPDAKELAVAAWVMNNGKSAGRGTETLNAAIGTYFPILGRSGVVGVLGMKLKGDGLLDLDQTILIETFLHQIAGGIERNSYQDQVRELLVIEETQKLYKSLLDCVSHELKTPLAAIKGSASAILDKKTNTNPIAVESLSKDILDASGRLQLLVENLLDMTRIESGMLSSKHEPHDVSDLLGVVLRRLEHLKGQRVVKLCLTKNLPAVVCDPVLTDQALFNILHNAFSYTPAESEIEISASEINGENVKIEIRDHGPGLPPDNPLKVLEKFYRGTPSKTGGVGLGLSIAKGFIESQGGSLTAANNPDGGATFTVSLLKEKPVGR